MLNKLSRGLLKREIPMLIAGLLTVTACAEAPKQANNPANNPTSPPAAAPEKSNSKLKININTAPIAELDKLELPGTKPSLSERIQAARPYKTIDDLVTKKAISAEELGLIKSLVTIEDK
ncbi:helix-hairpin-helix domain-containing protein [Pseudanabaena sp. 'Roaring Creek']|uniref:ComEA family DNA-binding protein n=1 Tax=Pseudanabaena sp. 'Roaring Creek' TaxID=1681830 RepID=UPI0006D82190|nr:helix-hairpin-helix domain-containing protein [Pseudanabaena sp. 'Roaring Creek']